MKNATKTLSGPLTAWWSARAPRERSVLRMAMWLLLVVAGGLLLESLVAERSRLARAVPEAQATLARMQADATELMRLHTLPPPAEMRPAALASAAASAAAARGLAVQVSPVDGGLAVSGQADLPALVEWLAVVQAELRLRPLRAKYDGGAVDLTLGWSDGAAR